MADIDVVLPCLNEAAGLTWILERLPPWVHPVVVDNGSTDGTAGIAHAAGCQVVTAPVRAGEADLVLGRRRAVSRAAWPYRLRLANHVLARRLRRRTGVRLHDLGPMRVARRQALLDLGLTDQRSGYPLETVLRAAEEGWRIREADVAYLPRIGRSKVTGTVRGTLQAVTDMRAVLRS